jgi:ribokinase
MMKKGILVIGSANMDMVARTSRFPRPGETILGSSFGLFPGGKGANQAVCCAKLGGEVYFLGKMGNDILGDRLASGMRHDGVRMNGLLVDGRFPTGIAIITVDRRGQNQIIVASGSNMNLTPADITRKRSLFARAGVLLAQLEIPLKTVERALWLAKACGILTILNPAPARKLPTSLLRMVDVLTPNMTELFQIAGLPRSGARDITRAARRLLERGVGNVIVTLGSRGCLLVARHGRRLFPPYRVKPVDTTAAGDALNGALAYALARGEEIENAIPFANAVGALSVTRMGAQSSMPTREEVRDFLRNVDTR